MSKRLLHTDPLTGLMTWHEYDPISDEMHIGYSADSTEILERNKVLQNDADYSKKGIKQEFWKYAEIPVQVQLDWLIQKGVDINNKDHAKKMFALLNDPEYKYLKTTTGYHQPKKYG